MLRRPARRARRRARSSSSSPASAGSTCSSTSARASSGSAHSYRQWLAEATRRHARCSSSASSSHASECGGWAASSSRSARSEALAQARAEALELLRRRPCARCATRGAAGTRAAPAAPALARACRRRASPARVSAHVGTPCRLRALEPARPRAARPGGRARGARRSSAAPARGGRGSPTRAPPGCRAPGGAPRARRAASTSSSDGGAGALGCGCSVVGWACSPPLVRGAERARQLQPRVPARAPRAALRDNRRASRPSNSVPGPGCWRTAGPLFQDTIDASPSAARRQAKLVESLSVDTPWFHAGHKCERRVTTERQQQTPYLDALCEYAAPQAGAAARAWPQGRPGRGPGHARGVRRAGAQPRHPGADVRHRRGRRADPVRAGPAPGRRGVGGQARVVPGQRRLAGQPRGRPRARPPRRRGGRPAQRALEHDRRARAVGPAPDVRGARGRPRAGDRPLPDRRRRSSDALDATPRRGRRVGDLADLLRRGGGRARRWRRWRTPAACRWSSTRRGARTWPSTRSCPSTRSRWAPTS